VVRAACDTFAALAGWIGSADRPRA